ncbi:Uma2 family endonuclease [Thermosynechococcaceae cyanobacterium BACA0444]|uniref:Uma2 family endonuclease n=1 Tax=Pseudocalidococcus azoricus BACA0444 TaxID=2918990 RepID=A0AAE4JZD2_9CYAN|nr:Uma2 family endonuclease [Pseudocalidococcus azoricus]MDS3860682.1 Uma2 family endonuclease [Pseudocalidococcus azoricus BACA0444]
MLASSSESLTYLLDATSAVLHHVSWETFEKLIEETGEDRKARFYYLDGDLEITAPRILPHVSWETFEKLIEETGEDRKARFYYLDGDLEIMPPLAVHEGSKCFLSSLIRTLCDELKINIRELGSMFLKTDNMSRGCEPDSCYYIQHEPVIRGKVNVDLRAGDPPPDLILEVDATSSSLPRLPIYASLGIPEVWRYDGKTLQYYLLEQGSYYHRVTSLIFPQIPAPVFVEFLQKRLEIGETQTLQEFRAWVKRNS